jgi:glycosyltransferase involved in cell wall biosynthesis
MAVHEAPPDVIVAAIPSLEWAQAAIDFGRARGIPVVIDVRDLWPDVYLNSLPARARGLGRFLLAPYRRVASRVCRQATALTAVSQSYLNWALGHAGRPQRELDRVVPLGYERIEISTNEHDKHIARLQAQGIDPSLPTCLFAGILERSSDVETVVRAARRLEQRGAEVQFILCGDGSKAAALRRQAAGLRNVHFLGWVDGAMLQSAAAISSIGLCAYASDALQSLPNKPFEYMASRLAIVSSLSGELANLLEKSGSGVTYTAGDDEGMANAIARLVGQPERLAAMRSNGYTTWSQSFRSCEIYCDFAARLASLTSLTRAAA